MARDTRVRNQQVGANLNLQSVALQQGNRGFQVGVSDRNVRAAQALQNAFGVGVQAATAIQTDRNATGRQQAIVERASGAEGRDVDNKQAGYLRTWDQLDAEFDYNTLEASMGEFLRGIDAENLTEPELQGSFNEYMESQFGGLDPQSAYAETLAPKILNLEQSVIANHRATQLAKTKEEQRTKLYVNAEAAYKANPEAGFDHVKLFEQTGTLFEGAEKKEVYWDTVIAAAIENGDPSILDSVPTMINGVPTGSKDPAFAQKLEAAKNSAAGVANQKYKAQAAADKKANDALKFQQQNAIVNAALEGKDTTALIEELSANPEADFASVTAAVNFARTSLSDQQTQSPDFHELDKLNFAAFDGKATADDVLKAYNDGVFGFGPQASAKLKEMLTTVERMQDKGEVPNAEAIGASRTLLRSIFNPQLQGQFGAFDKRMSHIQNNAISAFNEMVYEDGMDPLEATRKIREIYEPMADDAGIDADSRPGVINSVLTTTAMMSAVDTGDTTIFAGIPDVDVQVSLVTKYNEGTITQEQATEVLLLLGI